MEGWGLHECPTRSCLAHWKWWMEIEFGRTVKSSKWYKGSVSHDRFNWEVHGIDGIWYICLDACSHLRGEKAIMGG